MLLLLLPLLGLAAVARAHLPWTRPESPGIERILGLDAPRFEQALRERSADPTRAALSSADLEALGAALSLAPNRATRAALLLAASRSPAASEVLMQRLEARIELPTRHGDAADLTAAAALARFPGAERCADRLLGLVEGAEPHPDLEVRTECAIAALALGRRESIPFLLRVLRIDTPSAQGQPALTRSATTAWPRGRAGEALCRAAGVPFVDWSDRPLSERQAQADRLEALLLPR